MRTQVDVTKTTASNLASNAVLVTDSQIHGRHLGCKAVRNICCRKEPVSNERVGEEKKKQNEKKKRNQGSKTVKGWGTREGQRERERRGRGRKGVRQG